MIKVKITDEIIREACLVAGFLLLAIGLWLIYPPAMFLVCGLLLLWVGFPSGPKKGGNE
ncbi:MAG: hypothetical protein JWM44_1189 [Bacilli bacterium]|nr:hypothetical protein [Bacilli bacterium]